jgi:hypothetical protein
MPRLRNPGVPRDQSKAGPVTANVPSAQHRGMSEVANNDIALGPEKLAALLAEIRRYLDAVELFRREGREPHWRFKGEKEVL